MLITEVATGRILRQYVINIGSIDHSVAGNEAYFVEAWRCAVEDGLVKMDDREKYTFEFAQ